MKRLFASIATAFLTISSTALTDARAQTVEIEYWQYFFKERVTAVDKLIVQFEADNPDIKVVDNDIPYAQ